MIVCVCRRVSDRDIARHVRAGMDFDDIQFELGVAMQCGQCESCARSVVAQCSVSGTTAALHHEGTAQAGACGHLTNRSVPIQLSPRITENRAWSSSSHLAAA